MMHIVMHIEVRAPMRGRCVWMCMGQCACSRGAHAHTHACTCELCELLLCGRVSA